MNGKLRRVIAIIALVFMAIFSVSLVLYLLDKTLFNGAIGIFTLFFGGVGIALFVVLKLSRDNIQEIIDKAKLDEDEPTQEETAGEKTDENSEN